eukprot:Skav214493  [mRNA]  locus=scaffold1011:123348:127941:- [translate_table: standard]
MVFDGSFSPFLVTLCHAGLCSGLGLRATSAHAAAAYIASVGSSLQAGSALDGAFSINQATAAPALHAAVTSLNHRLVGETDLTVAEAVGLRQQQLSKRLDMASWQSQLGRSSLVEQAHLRSEAELGARAFLAAVPSGACRMEGPAFLTELRARLGVPDVSSDCWCPRCDAVLDTMGHHAAMCSAGGERTLRHHAVRDLVFKWADKAGLRPEKEPSRLLLPQGPDDTNGGVDLQLCLPTYRDTFLASLIATLFLSAGLLSLSISETSWPGLEKEHWIVLLFRTIAWAALYFVPVHVVAILNLRSFAYYGISPGNSCLVCWRAGIGPAIIGEVVEDLGLSHRPWISRGMVFVKAIQWLHMAECASTRF